jgi:putative methyltransferase (TIGR04325 family)
VIGNQTVRRFYRRLQAAPGIKHATDLFYERRFSHWPGAFRGVFRNFEQAARSAPANRRIGFDHPELATMYAERRSRIFEADYPVLFWLGRILQEETTVFDFGGHTGVAFYGFESYLHYPHDLTWTVYDVPRVLVEGRRVLAQRPRAALRFSADLSELARHAIFHASGALQYVETSLSQQLEKLSALPKHLLLNKLPLWAGEPFVTLQNTLHSYNPYAIYNHDAFIGSLHALGYQTVDEWDDWERSCRPLNEPNYQVPHYSGLYLRLASTP